MRDLKYWLYVEPLSPNKKPKIYEGSTLQEVVDIRDSLSSVEVKMKIISGILLDECLR
jgi:hypothetical protein